MSKSTPNEKNPKSIVTPKYEYPILEGMDILVSRVRLKGLTPEFWEETEDVFTHLTSMTKLSRMQVLIVATLIDEDGLVSWSALAKIYGISRIKMMSYGAEVNELVQKQWVERGLCSGHSIKRE